MANRRLGIGVIGAGGIARRKTIPAMMEAKNLRVVALMDPKDVEAIAAQFGVAKAYRREEDLFADPEVEAVYIASPVAAHSEQIEKAAAAGKHVLCEKPLTMSLKQTKAAVAACRKRRVFLQEGYMMKFHGAHAAIKETIDGGRLGRLVYLRAQLSCWYPKIPGAWRQDTATGGGGSLIDMATHLFDLLEFFAGPIRRVATLTGNLVQDYASEDAATVLLEFASGAHGTIDCFFCIPDEASRTRLEIYGSRGSILTEGTIGQSKRGLLEAIFGLGDTPYDPGQEKDVVRVLERVRFPIVDPYRAECEYFARCVLENRPPAINDGANAIHIAEVTEKAYAAAKRKAFVAI